MSNFEFSAEQKKVIDTRNRNILVSAAAGSGKTTVLVERIMRIIENPDNPVDIDRLLVLTFTNAAAAEMRERVIAALKERVAHNPDNEHLRRQQVLVFNAQITTIHSFCNMLLRNEFARVGLEPGFRVVDKGEYNLIYEEAMAETLEEVLGNRDIEYLDELLLWFKSKDNNSSLREAVDALYTAANNAPFVEDYLEQRRRDYTYSSVEDMLQSPCCTYLLAQIDSDMKKAVELARINLELAESSVIEYINNARADYELLNIDPWPTDFEEWRNIFIKLRAVGFTKKSGKKGSDEGARNEFSRRRDELKDLANYYISDSDSLFANEPEELLRQSSNTGRVINALVDVTLRFHINLESHKKDRGVITFADMEHLALKLLNDRVGNTYVPSDIALGYRDYYYEIMVDEYQDSNYIQETLLRSISKESVGLYNRFMVGDVKQSIYRFRNANPELFTEKYNTYTHSGQNEMRIDLSSNFRSRTDVTDSVNEVFKELMTSDRGGIVYDDAAALHLGNKNYKESGWDNTTELLALHTDKASGYSTTEQEALLIGNRIRELLESGYVQDKETGVMRKCTLRDIVILVRSGSGFSEECKRVLDLLGIPSYITSKGGFFAFKEITDVLNLLSVIDNPRNEVELYGVMTSVFGNFNENELAICRIINKGGLYESLEYISNCEETELVNKLSDIDVKHIRQLKQKTALFLDKITEYRDCVKYMSIDCMLNKIYNDYSYVNYVSALPGGEQRRANVLMLIQKATGFEANGFKGLFKFNKYVEGIKAYGSDDGDASTLDENAQVVRIMTMHASKGLEFPVCIVSNTAKSFSNNDISNRTITDTALGMGTDYVDIHRSARFPDIRKKVIAGKIRKDNLAEEIRILYVAMTRAKEKLIITGCFDNKGGVPSATTNSELGLLMTSKLQNDWNSKISMEIIDIADVLSCITLQEVKTRIDINDFKRELAGAEVDKDLKERMVFKYRHEELQNLHAKTSVSELKHAAIKEQMQILSSGYNDEDASDESFQLFPTDSQSEYIPSFIPTEAREASGAARGSAYHRLMELLDFGSMDNLSGDSLKKSLEKEIASYIDEGILESFDAEMINRSKVITLLESDLGQRLIRASANNLLMREQPFVLGISANRVDPKLPEEEMVLIQGIIDAFLQEEDGYVLIDYKTDSVTSDKELIDRYRVQMDYYEEAIYRITGKKVKERILYSFALNKEIKDF